MTKSIYVVGAQCTGKTTLVNALEEHFYQARNLELPGKKRARPPIVIREVARTALKNTGMTRREIKSSPARSYEFQKHILLAQHFQELATGPNSETWAISDRSGIDPIVYTHMLVGEQEAGDMLGCKVWQTLKAKMSDSLVVVCEAGCSWLQDDGTRLMPENLEEWMNLHELFCKLLDQEQIDYHIIPATQTELKDRVNTVSDLWKQTNA